MVGRIGRDDASSNILDEDDDELDEDRYIGSELEDLNKLPDKSDEPDRAPGSSIDEHRELVQLQRGLASEIEAEPEP
jgi:hypothetical protein